MSTWRFRALAHAAVAAAALFKNSEWSSAQASGQEIKSSEGNGKLFSFFRPFKQTFELCSNCRGSIRLEPAQARMLTYLDFYSRFLPLAPTHIRCPVFAST